MKKAPKAHAFIKIELNSSMVYATAGTASVSLMTIITLNSAYLFAAGILLNTLYESVGLLTPLLINVMEHIIQGIIEISTRVSTELNGTGLSYPMLQSMHAYLTPYLRSYHSIFCLLRRIVGFFASSPELNQMQDLYARFLAAGQNLMSLYRQIEGLLNISLGNSPVSTQV